MRTTTERDLDLAALHEDEDPVVRDATLEFFGEHDERIREEDEDSP